jgi:cephalosporin hydroxylase
LEARKYSLGYHTEWLGIPVIRLAEDLVRQQEIIFRERHDLIIEVGVARGGGLVFSASMQEIASIKPNVIGVDNKIFAHTRSAIADSKYHSAIRLVEADSTSPDAIDLIRKSIEVEQAKSCLLILDSDHSTQHVLEELRAYSPLLPEGSTVMVCDTIIDEFPPGTYEDRTWSNGSGPGKAIEVFLEEGGDLVRVQAGTDDLLLTEMRGGILRKVLN